MQKQQLINQLYQKVSFWSDYYIDKHDELLAFEFDAVSQCLLSSQTVFPLSHVYPPQAKQAALPEAKSYIKELLRHEQRRGVKDTKKLLQQYLQQF